MTLPNNPKAEVPNMNKPKCICDQCTGKEPMSGLHVFVPATQSNSPTNQNELVESSCVGFDREWSIKAVTHAFDSKDLAYQEFLADKDREIERLTAQVEVMSEALTARVALTPHT